MGTLPGGSRTRRGAAGQLCRRQRLWLGVLLFGLVAGGAMASIELTTGLPGGAVIGVPEALNGNPAAALRAALAALEAGDSSRADALLAAVAERYSVVADYADLLRLRLRVDASAFEEAITLGVTWRHADSPLRSERDEILGNAHAALGYSRAARAAWARAAEATDDGARRAALQLKLAESLAADGDGDGAVKAYLKVWTAHPLSPESERATAALDAIAQRRGADPRTATQYRRRGDTLFLRRRNESALAAYERALASKTLSAAEVRRARSQRAQTLFRLRRYSEAVAAFEQLPATVDNRIDRARAVARAGNAAQGARDLEAIARDAPGRRGARALFLAGLLWEGEGEAGRARRLFEEVVRSASGTSYANAALWSFGWAAFRDGRIDEARSSFERLLAGDGDEIAALRTRYWLARTLERAGTDGAAEAFAAIAREFPLSYYGWRASLRVDAAPASEPAAAIPLGRAVLGPGDVARPRILLEAGLDAEARRELDRLYPRAASLADRLALSSLYASSGDFHRSQRLIVDEYANALARGPVPQQLELWWYAWPDPFADGMRRATADGDLVEAELVYALMREESGYQPTVVSVAGARGLLQIMPATGERLAREIALASFGPDDLFLPEVNLRLGSHYLSQLLRRFEGQKSAAIASYNAGPAAVSRWLDPTLEDDEWVESIPYEETRSYVKRVLRSLHAYRVLY